MKMKRKWQRGEADIVTVAVGMVILSIIVAGTSSAMIYGRDVLIRQENQKAVAYLLRGYVDEWQAKLQMEAGQRTDGNLGRSFSRRSRDLTTNVAGGTTPPLEVDLVRDPVLKVDLSETGAGIDWYVLSCSATWIEDELSGDDPESSGQARSLSFRTYVVVRS